MHKQDAELSEDYLDWFFLNYYGKGPNFWRSLTEEKIQALITFQEEKEKVYWNNWQTMFKGMFGK